MKKNDEHFDNLKLLIETKQMIVDRMKEVLAELQHRIDETKARQQKSFDGELVEVDPRKTTVSSTFQGGANSPLKK